MTNNYIAHHGIKGQKWGVRREQNRKGLSDKQKKTLKTVGLVAGGVAVGASVVGAAWYIKNKKSLKILKQKKALSIAKGQATKAARRASGAYQSFKNVDVLVSGGSDFSKQFMNVKVAKLIL